VQAADIDAGVVGMSRIGRTVLAAPAASITFSAIPQTYSTLMLVVVGRGDSAVASVTLGMRLNGDVGNNYEDQQVYGNGIAAAAVERVAAAFNQIGYVPGSTMPANLPGQAVVLLGDYTGTAFKKVWTSENHHRLAAGAGGGYTAVFSGAYTLATPAAVTSLTVLSATGNLIIGSTATLYGVY